MTFEFESPIEVAHGGEVISCNRIEFTAPKASQRKKTTKLKQMFFRAVTGSADARPNIDKADKPKKDDLNGAELLIVMAQSDVDYVDFIEVGRSLVCENVGKLDGVEPFTVHIADNLDSDVLESIIGEYVANFILRSALKSAMKT